MIDYLIDYINNYFIHLKLNILKKNYSQFKNVRELY